MDVDFYDDGDDDLDGDLILEGDWDYNVKNCSVPVERSVMISCDSFNNTEWIALEAGVILGKLNITEYNLHRCGKWRWLEFVKEEDAVAFKLMWE